MNPFAKIKKAVIEAVNKKGPGEDELPVVRLTDATFKLQADWLTIVHCEDLVRRAELTPPLVQTTLECFQSFDTAEFRHVFGDGIPLVEAVAKTFAADLRAILQNGQAAQQDVLKFFTSPWLLSVVDFFMVLITSDNTTTAEHLGHVTGNSLPTLLVMMTTQFMEATQFMDAGEIVSDDSVNTCRDGLVRTLSMLKQLCSFRFDVWFCAQGRTLAPGTCKASSYVFSAPAPTPMLAYSAEFPDVQYSSCLTSLFCLMCQPTKVDEFLCPGQCYLLLYLTEPVDSTSAPSNVCLLEAVQGIICNICQHGLDTEMIEMFAKNGMVSSILEHLHGMNSSITQAVANPSTQSCSTDSSQPAIPSVLVAMCMHAAMSVHTLATLLAACNKLGCTMLVEQLEDLNGYSVLQCFIISSQDALADCGQLTVDLILGSMETLVYIQSPGQTSGDGDSAVPLMILGDGGDQKQFASNRTAFQLLFVDVLHSTVCTPLQMSMLKILTGLFSATPANYPVLREFGVLPSLLTDIYKYKPVVQQSIVNLAVHVLVHCPVTEAANELHALTDSMQMDVHTASGAALSPHTLVVILGGILDILARPNLPYRACLQELGYAETVSHLVIRCANMVLDTQVDCPAHPGSPADSLADFSDPICICPDSVSEPEDPWVGATALACCSLLALSEPCPDNNTFDVSNRSTFITTGCVGTLLSCLCNSALNSVSTVTLTALVQHEYFAPVSRDGTGVLTSILSTLVECRCQGAHFPHTLRLVRSWSKADCPSFHNAFRAAGGYNALLRVLDTVCEAANNSGSEEVLLLCFQLLHYGFSSPYGRGCLQFFAQDASMKSFPRASECAAVSRCLFGGWLHLFCILKNLPMPLLSIAVQHLQHLICLTCPQPEQDLMLTDALFVLSPPAQVLLALLPILPLSLAADILDSFSNAISSGCTNLRVIAGEFLQECDIYPGPCLLLQFLSSNQDNRMPHALQLLQSMLSCFPTNALIQQTQQLFSIPLDFFKFMHSVVTDAASDTSAQPSTVLLSPSSALLIDTLPTDQWPPPSGFTLSCWYRRPKQRLAASISGPHQCETGATTIHSPLRSPTSPTLGSPCVPNSDRLSLGPVSPNTQKKGVSHDAPEIMRSPSRSERSVKNFFRMRSASRVRSKSDAPLPSTGSSNSAQDLHDVLFEVVWGEMSDTNVFRVAVDESALVVSTDVTELRFANFVLKTDQWHHISVVHSRSRLQASTLAVYLDGTLFGKEQLHYPSPVSLLERDVYGSDYLAPSLFVGVSSAFCTDMVPNHLQHTGNALYKKLLSSGTTKFQSRWETSRLCLSQLACYHAPCIPSSNVSVPPKENHAAAYEHALSLLSSKKGSAELYSARWQLGPLHLFDDVLPHAGITLLSSLGPSVQGPFVGDWMPPLEHDWLNSTLHPMWTSYLSQMSPNGIVNENMTNYPPSNTSVVPGFSSPVDLSEASNSLQGVFSTPCLGTALNLSALQSTPLAARLQLISGPKLLVSISAAHTMVVSQHTKTDSDSASTVTASQAVEPADDIQSLPCTGKGNSEQDCAAICTICLVNSAVCLPPALSAASAAAVHITSSPATPTAQKWASIMAHSGPGRDLGSVGAAIKDNIKESILAAASGSGFVACPSDAQGITAVHATAVGPVQMWSPPSIRLHSLLAHGTFFPLLLHLIQACPPCTSAVLLPLAVDLAFTQGLSPTLCISTKKTGPQDMLLSSIQSLPAPYLVPVFATSLISHITDHHGIAVNRRLCEEIISPDSWQRTWARMSLGIQLQILDALAKALSPQSTPFYAFNASRFVDWGIVPGLLGIALNPPVHPAAVCEIFEIVLAAIKHTTSVGGLQQFSEWICALAVPSDNTPHPYSALISAPRLSSLLNMALHTVYSAIISGMLDTELAMQVFSPTWCLLTLNRKSPPATACLILAIITTLLSRNANWATTLLWNNLHFLLAPHCNQHDVLHALACCSLGICPDVSPDEHVLLDAVAALSPSTDSVVHPGAASNPAGNPGNFVMPKGLHTVPPQACRVSSQIGGTQVETTKKSGVSFASRQPEDDDRSTPAPTPCS
eukprot:gene7829-191_t